MMRRKLVKPSKSDTVINAFDLDFHIMAESYVVLGTIGSGKTTLARHVLLTFEPENIMAFCGSVASKKAFREFIHTDSIYSDIELFPPALEELKANLEVWDEAEYAWDKTEAARESNKKLHRPYPVKKPQKFFIFDDMSHHRHIFKNGKTSLQFEYLVQNTRHTGGYMMCCQNMTNLMPIARQQAMNIFFMNEPTPKMCKAMFEEFGRGITKYDFIDVLQKGIFDFNIMALCPVNKARDAYNKKRIAAKRKRAGKRPRPQKTLDGIGKIMFGYLPIDKFRPGVVIGEDKKKAKRRRLKDASKVGGVGVGGNYSAGGGGGHIQSQPHSNGQSHIKYAVVSGDNGIHSKPRTGYHRSQSRSRDPNKVSSSLLRALRSNRPQSAITMMQRHRKSLGKDLRKLRDILRTLSDANLRIWWKYDLFARTSKQLSHVMERRLFPGRFADVRIVGTVGAIVDRQSPPQQPSRSEVGPMAARQQQQQRQHLQNQQPHPLSQSLTQKPRIGPTWSQYGTQTPSKTQQQQPPSQQPSQYRPQTSYMSRPQVQPQQKSQQQQLQKQVVDVEISPDSIFETDPWAGAGF